MHVLKPWSLVRDVSTPRSDLAPPDDPLGPVGGPGPWINTFTYDGSGRLVSETAGMTGDAFTYTLDTGGRRQSSTVAIAGGPPIATTIVRDAEGLARHERGRRGGMRGRG